MTSLTASLRRAAKGFAAALLLTPALAGAAKAEMASVMRASWVQPVAATDAAVAPPGVPLHALVDLSEQSMKVFRGDELIEVFKVSTGRMGYGTPAGEYSAQWMTSMWRSRKYNMAPMPWSVFFHGGYAIHGTTDIRNLGRPASHGCVRLHPANAKTFFALVQKSGKDNTTISIVR
jgi:lipoprotein-anchoring transpeptidase ErfK/SrfK